MSKNKNMFIVNKQRWTDVIGFVFISPISAEKPINKK